MGIPGVSGGSSLTPIHSKSSTTAPPIVTSKALVEDAQRYLENNSPQNLLALQEEIKRLLNESGLSPGQRKLLLAMSEEAPYGISNNQAGLQTRQAVAAEAGWFNDNTTKENV